MPDNSRQMFSIVSMQETRLEGISLAISTVDRPGNYIHKVMSRLDKKIPLHLVVGSPKYDYLKRYCRNPNVEIIGIDPADWHRFKDFNVRHRASWNYWRCFVHGIRPERHKGLLILEDDVLPAKGWEKRLRATMQQIESQYGDEYVLSLYTCYSELPKPAADSYYARYPARVFAGTQAVYYPEPIRAAFAEYLRAEGVESFRKPYDYLLGEYLRLAGIPCFATTPCLFEHIGEVTTGLSPIFHRAGCFQKAIVRHPSSSRKNNPRKKSTQRYKVRAKTGRA